jgi:sugar/nucleoside kinase (ribokinase family)
LVIAKQMPLTIGGCAANVAVDLARLGIPASVAACVGGDIFGRVVADILRGNHVDVSSLRVTIDRDTSQTMIVNVVGQDRRFIHSVGANAAFCASDIPRERLQTCRVLYVGGYFIMDSIKEEELVEVFAAAHRAGAKTVLDVVTPGPADYLSRLRKLLPHVDVLLPNELEAELILGETDALRQALRFRELGAATVIITMGAHGSILVGESVRLRANAYSVPFVDGTGSGDAFAAGYIYGLLRGHEEEECLRIGSAVGASCVRAVGTTTGVFNENELQSFINENRLDIQRLS